MMLSRMQPVLKPLQIWWQQRQQRERQALKMLAGAAMLAMLFQLTLFLVQRTQALREQLPRLRQQWLQMQADVQQLKRLETGHDQPPVLLPPDRTALPPPPDGIAADWQDETRLHAKGETVLDAWVEWTGTLHQTQGLILRQASLTPLPVAGRVRVDAVFEFAGTRP